MLWPIPAFADNYIWAFSHGAQAWVVDPGDATVVVEALRQKNLQLAGILLTHHHGDHSGGIADLLSQTIVPVFGPSQSPAQALISHVVSHGDSIAIGPWQFDVIGVPGHTLDHLAFHCRASNWLFCGDTLFSAGCGRLFEGTPEQMYASLQRLAALPDETVVCCAHEYTLSNLRFAQAVEPDNDDIRQHVRHCEALRESGKPTLPSSMRLEKKINPFLHCADAREFATRRSLKDQY